MDKITIASRGEPQSPVRLPGDLRDRIKRVAKENGRSMNTEIVARLQSSFEPRDEVAPVIAKLLEDYIQQEVKARLQQIAAQIGGGA